MKNYYYPGKYPDKGDLENVHWVEDEKDGMGGSIGVPVNANYKTFDEVRNAILEFGPIIIKSDRVDLAFFVLDGRFDNEIMAVRQSGLNIRRFLVKEDCFEAQFGNFSWCVDHLMSNNTVDCKIELAHLEDYLKGRDIDPNNFDVEKHYTRLDVDAVAAGQLLSIKAKHFSENEDQEFLFALGYSIGRLFSSIQNLATLEDAARKGFTAERNYKEKGNKSRSEERKNERLDAFIGEIEIVYENNMAMRPYEDMVLKVAFNVVIPEGTYGHGQFDEYCTIIRSQEPYKERFDKLFSRLLK